MSQKTVDVIRVGESDARILRVTRMRIEYIGMAGQEQSIDLKECARNWERWHDDHVQDFLLLPGASEADRDAWNARCIGRRGALDDPPWAEFEHERKTRFEFLNYEALYRELLRPLMEQGWHTFDTD